MQGAIEMNGFHIHGLPLPIHVQDVWRRKDYQDFTLPYLYWEGARVYHDVDQVIPDASWVTLAFNSERWDTDNIHDNVTNNSRLTCKTAGVYAVSFHGYWEAWVAGERHAYIQLNDTTIIVYQVQPLSNTGRGDHVFSTIYKLAVDDYLETRVYQNRGGILDFKSTAERTPEFSMQRIG
ncbi:hypothetical protein ES703_112098 [subsurface metagenome]